MQTVTISPKFQVVIPRRVRERMGLRPGEKLQVIGIKTPRERLFRASISPDGKQVAYSRWPNTPGMPDYLCEIHVIDVDGSNPRHLAGDNDVRQTIRKYYGV